MDIVVSLCWQSCNNIISLIQCFAEVCKLKNCKKRRIFTSGKVLKTEQRILPADAVDEGPVDRRVWQCDVANLNIEKAVLSDQRSQRRGLNADIPTELDRFSLVIETTVETLVGPTVYLDQAW